MIITLQHCRIANFCTPGIRRLTEEYGIDLRKAVREGITDEELLKYDNPYFNELVRVAREWETKK